MTHSEKLVAMRKHFATLGISPIAGVPPVWRFLWALGVAVPPPVFMRFSSVAWILGSVFAITWAMYICLRFSLNQDLFAWLVIGLAISAGVLFGLGMAWRCRAIARKYNLPLWADYKGQQQS